MTICQEQSSKSVKFLNLTNYSPYVESRIMKNRIRELRKAKGWTMEELAKETGYSFAKVNRDERGFTQLNQKKISAYAKALNCTETDVLGLDNPSGQSLGSDTMRMDQAIPIKSGIDTVPVLGHIEGSDEAVDMTGEPVGYIQRHPSQQGSKHAFAFYAPGKSMSPRYDEGEPAFFIKGKPALPGQDCLVELTNGRGYLKRFEKRTDKEVICRQLNPDKKWIKKISEVKAIHAVVGRG